MLKTGMIGLGAMGWHMAENLFKAGLLTSVWNRSEEKAERFCLEKNITPENSPAELASCCDVVVVCVSRDEDVTEVIQTMLPGCHTGLCVIDCSTTSMQTAKTMQAILQEKSVHFLDAPVSGGVEGARLAELVFMIGGEERQIQHVLPLFEAMGKKSVHMGPVGSGQATKAVNQIMAAGINQAVTEALAFGECMGLDMDKVIDVVGGGAAGNWFLNKRGATMLAGEFNPGFKLALHHKDLKICAQMLEDKNRPVPGLISDTLADYEELMGSGRGEEDISALFRKKQALFARGGEK